MVRSPDMGEKLDLFYGDELLGTVSTNQTSFPSSSGQIQFNPETLENDKDLMDYIESSRKAADEMLAFNGSFYQYRNNKERSTSHPVIDTQRWCVISKDGAKTKIRPPLFLKDNGIVFTVDK